MIEEVLDALGEWEDRADLASVYVASRHRGRAVHVVFAGDRAPAYVVKVEVDARRHHRLRRERDTLEILRDHARARDRVPRAVRLLELRDGLALVQSVVPGTEMGARLRRQLRPHVRRVQRDHAMLREWLDVLGPAGDGPRSVRLEPAEVTSLVARASAGSEVPGVVLDRLAGTAVDAGPLDLPLQRVHGDLHTGNYLVHRGRINVVDWEGGLSTATPLVELLAALLQYGQGITAGGWRLPSLLDSFSRTFLPGHWLQEVTHRTWVDVVAGLGVDPRLADYLFVATLAAIVSPETGAGPGEPPKLSWQRPDWRPALHRYLTHGPWVG